MRAQFVFSEVWVGLRRNLTMTIALVVVVAISLSLLGTGLLFVKQVDHGRAYWQSRVQISVYLCSPNNSEPNCLKYGPVTSAEMSTILSTLNGMNSQVAHVTYVTAQQNQQTFRQEYPSMAAEASFIGPSFEVRLHNAQADAASVTAGVTGMRGVANVVDESTILNQLYGLLDAARNAVVIVAIILIVAAILLVANTIRLSAFNRRRETAIMRLVGASNFYVQLPFLMEGMIAGLLGWLIAAALLVGARVGLDGLQNYLKFPVTLSMTDLVEVIVVTMLIGLVLTGMTSFLTLRRYLRV